MTQDVRLRTKVALHCLPRSICPIISICQKSHELIVLLSRLVFQKNQSFHSLFIKVA